MRKSGGEDTGPFIVEDRSMLSRAKGDRIRLTHIIQPGERVPGCCVCFTTPISLPLLAQWCCCFQYPKYILNKISSSKYIYIRENSMEWNEPYIRAANGYFCGSACCEMDIKDNITVLYFDDMHFGEVTNQTRRCNDIKSFCCGGEGQIVQIESRFCWGMCKRGGPCPFLFAPICFTRRCCSCLISYELHVEHADSAIEAITMARDSAEERIENKPRIR